MLYMFTKSRIRTNEFMISDKTYLAGETGLEPATCGFGDRCSAN